MAVLEIEIQLPDGNRQAVTVSSQEPAFFGRDPRCTVRLDDPAVDQVHFRIRHQRGAWILEVASGAASVLLNGQQTRRAELEPGDQVQVGATMLYVAPAAAPPPEAAPEVGVPSWTPEPAPPPPKPTPSKPPAPPQDNILRSPLILGSAAALVALLALGTYLYFWYYGRTSEALFDQAQEAMNEGRSVYARKLFQRFVDEYPEHELYNLAIIYRELCDVQAAQNEGNPSRALEELVDLFERTSKFPEFQDIVGEVAETAVRVALSLAEAAQTTGRRRDYEQARLAFEVIQERVPEEKTPAEGLQRLEAALAKAEDAVVKKERYDQTLQQMRDSIAQQNTETAYRARDALVAMYPDLAGDEQLRQLMQQAADVDQSRCRWEPTQLRPQATDREQPTIALAVTPTSSQAAGPAGVGYQLAAGVLYAVSTRNGQPLWRRVLGQDARYLPVALQGATAPRIAVLAPQHQELAVLEAESGKLVWRLSFDEPLDAPPILHRGKLYLATRAGNLYRIDPGSGRVEGRLHLGDQELTVPPVPSVSGRHLYQVGEHSNVYIVAVGSRALETVGLFYLGHLNRTVQAAPLRMGRYLLVCENRQTRDSVVHVLLAAENERTFEKLPQAIHLPGWVLSTPASYGNLIYIATDRDTVHLFSAGAPERKEGLKQLTAARPATVVEPTGPAYAVFIDEENLLVAGGTVRHYHVSLERQTLRPAATVDGISGATVQPVQKISDRVFLIGWRANNEPAVRLTAVRFTGSGFEKLWETSFALGVASLRTGPDGSAYLATATADLVQLPAVPEHRSVLFLQRTLGRIAFDPLQLRRAKALRLRTGQIVYVPEAGATELYVRESVRSTQVRRIALPAGIAAAPCSFAGALLVPATDQRIYLISLQDGHEVAEPFQPPVQYDVQRHWTALVPLSDTTVLAADQTGAVFVLELREEQRGGTTVRYLNAVGETSVPDSLREPVVLLSDNVLAFVTSRREVVFAALPLLDELKRYALPADTQQPQLVVSQQRLVVSDARGRLMAFDHEGNPLWNQTLPGPLAGRPVPHGGQLYCALRNGVVVALALENGAIRHKVRIGEPLRGDPQRVGAMLLCPAFDGTIHLLSIEGGA